MTGETTDRIILNLDSESFYNKMKRGAESGRTGEVVFGILRPNGKVIAVTCAGYPDGVYRIPSGGTGGGEDICAAVAREAKEELGLELEKVRLVRTLNIIFRHGGRDLPFKSYIFVACESGGRLMADATDDEISSIMEVGASSDLSDFEDMVKKLGEVQGDRSDWGRFRQLSSGAVLEYFRSKG